MTILPSAAALGTTCRRRWPVWGCGALWLLAVVAGLASLSDYNNAPGAPGRAPARWPHDSALPRVRGRVTIVIAAHPHCPCTRATIGELNALMARTERRAVAYVLFERPSGTSADWVVTDLWRSAREIPGVHAVRDDNGAQARLFGAVTSGQTAAYSAQGDLLFSGGITKARGHLGENAGRAALVSLVRGGPASHNRTPVYGCLLSHAAETLKAEEQLGGAPAAWHRLLRRTR